MQILTEGIVLRRIKYGDTGSIVHIFTRSEGMCHFIVKGLGTKSARGAKTAFFLPLTQLEFVMKANDNSLRYIKDVRICYPYKTLHQDIKKSTVAMFLAEVLSQSLGSEAKNTVLFDFMQDKFKEFDSTDSNSDFHILFLLDLTVHLGFYPQKNISGSPYFDLQNGCFCLDRPLHNNFFEGHKAMLFSNLLHYRKIEDRLLLLEAILSYYRVHLGVDNVHSLSVLHEVFS
ncbi:MAG: DNA repair protein RecO [Bacteroidales bacterium]|jgi:DNA repair protein RecO (recombination protein O)|nr:DNA repair protein RecO [Bacteroidales bacterium]